MTDFEQWLSEQPHESFDYDPLYEAREDWLNGLLKKCFDDSKALALNAEFEKLSLTKQE